MRLRDVGGAMGELALTLAKLGLCLALAVYDRVAPAGGARA
jgi:hypothetical protein